MIKVRLTPHNGYMRYTCSCGKNCVLWLAELYHYNKRCPFCDAQIPNINAMLPAPKTFPYKIIWHRKKIDDAINYWM